MRSGSQLIDRRDGDLIVVFFLGGGPSHGRDGWGGMRRGDGVLQELLVSSRLGGIRRNLGGWGLSGNWRLAIACYGTRYWQSVYCHVFDNTQADFQF